MDNISNYPNGQQGQTNYPPSDSAPYQPQLPPDFYEKRRFKSSITHLSGGLLIYNAILYVIVIAVMFMAIILAALKAGFTHTALDSEELLNKLMETDCGMMLGVILGCVFMALFFMKRLTIPKIVVPRKKMTLKVFLMLAVMLMSVQFPFAMFDELVETLLNMIGLSAQESIEASQAGSTTISMMLYAGFIGPVAEELIYRGFTMQTLEKTNAGKGYAVIISSVLFGAMHANPTQSIYAFFAGIVFAYAAMEYGIIWSAVLHIMNNFLFGDVFVFITNRIPETAGTILNYAVLIGFFAAAVILVIVKRKAVFDYIKENYPTPSKYYGWTFSNPLLIIFIAVNLIMAVMTITKLE